MKFLEARYFMVLAICADMLVSVQQQVHVVTCVSQQIPTISKISSLDS